MREQVVVLQPSIETNFTLSKKEEPLLYTSRCSRNRTVSERIDGETMNLIERDQQEGIPTQLASAEKMKKEDANEAIPPPPGGACEEEKAGEDGRLVGERMKAPSSSSGKGSLLLQWGVKKRPRTSRTDAHFHNASNQVDNHDLKPSSLADECSVLYRKTIRVQADRALVIEPNMSSLTSKEILKAKNDIGAKREHPLSEEKHNQQSKVLKGGSLDVKQGTSLGGGRRGCTSQLKQDQLVQQSRTCSLAHPNLSPQDRCATPQPSGNDASLSKKELVWPKFTFALSRKEKEEDYLILKGTKLPHRPLKRRPRVVEKALHYCFPGVSLADLSLSRYDVREKKHVRKRPSGLKAMEILGIDSD